MKPQEVKTKIARIKQAMREEEILIKAHERYREEENFNERMAKQKGIIMEAEEVVALIQKEYDEAPGKIEKIERHMRYEKRCLVVLNNYEKIERLKKIADELNEIQRLSIGDEDGKEHSHTQTQGQDRDS